MPLDNFGPPIPGVTKAEAPVGGQDLFKGILDKMMGRGVTPQKSSGDLIAEAVQLMRRAAEQDLRMAPLVNGALQMMITGGGAPPQGGAPPPPMGAPGGGSPMMGPAPQAAMSNSMPMA